MRYWPLSPTMSPSAFVPPNEQWLLGAVSMAELSQQLDAHLGPLLRQYRDRPIREKLIEYVPDVTIRTKAHVPA